MKSIHSVTLKYGILTLLILCLLVTLIGCASKSKTEVISTDQVSGFSDISAEKIFTGISDGDYAMFTGDFDQTMKAALPEDKFKEIMTELGTYQSKELAGADKVTDKDITYYRAYYKTRFTNIDKDVIFTIVFPAEGDKKVVGLFYNKQQ